MHLCDSTGQEHWEAWTCFSWTFPHVPFPFADFDLYPSTIINCNYEYNNFTESCESY